MNYTKKIGGVASELYDMPFYRGILEQDTLLSIYYVNS